MDSTSIRRIAEAIIFEQQRQASRVEPLLDDFNWPSFWAPQVAFYGPIERAQAHLPRETFTSTHTFGLTVILNQTFTSAKNKFDNRVRCPTCGEAPSVQNRFHCMSPKMKEIYDDLLGGNTQGILHVTIQKGELYEDHFIEVKRRLVVLETLYMRDLAFNGTGCGVENRHLRAEEFNLDTVVAGLTWDSFRT